MPGWSDAKPITRERKPYLSDEVDLFEFPPRKWVQVRYIGPFTSYAQGWLRLKNPKPGGNKYIRFPKVCLDYNPATQTFDKEICPYRKAGIYIPQRYVANFIVRDLQEDKPRRQREPTSFEKKRRNMLGERWHCKEMGTKTWTPVRAHDMPAGVANKLANLSELNTRRKNGKKVAYDITDPRYGMDVLVKFDPKAKGAAMWDVQRAEPTRLSSTELAYLIYNLKDLKSLAAEDKKTARTEWKRIEPNWRPEKRTGFTKPDADKSNNKSGRRQRNSNKRQRPQNKRQKQMERRPNKKRASAGRNRFRDLDDLD